MRPRITRSSVASLGSVSLLGEAAVDITPASSGTPVPEWGYVPSGAAPGSLATAATQATKSLEQATALLTDIAQGRGTLGKLVTDDSSTSELNEFVASAEAVTDGIEPGPRHARPAGERSCGGEVARGLAAEPRGGDRSNSRRRGKPRAAAERRRPEQIVDVGDEQSDAITGRINRVKERRASW